MKKLLIIGMSLNVGGAEKSLVNLLNMIDYSQYNVDLLLFQERGDFLKQVPSEVNIISERIIKVLFQSFSDTLRLPSKGFKDIYFILLRYIASIIETLKWKQFDQIRIHRWIDFYKNAIPNNKNIYDVAVAYAGGDTAYYMVDKVNAVRKVYFFHSDYSKINIDADLERRYVNQVDTVITISNICKRSLDKLFPEKKKDIVVLRNLSSPKLIWKLANEYKPKEFGVKENTIKLVSVGRLNAIKGYDIAVEAANILKKSGVDFRWVVVGEGEERRKIERQIKRYGLEQHVILTGLKVNPYPYILNSDILLQTSYFEGRSVVLDEAKILKTPAIITNYNSAHDQIQNGIDGLIVEMSAEGIAAGIINCIQDKAKLLSMKDAANIDSTVNDIECYMKVLINY
jgi:glycosyltransferase involved in cell wall biosynthesis